MLENDLSITIRWLCYFSLYLWLTGAVFFGSIACNFYPPTPIWQRIVAAVVILWSFYLFNYVFDLSLRWTPVDSRIWNFPAYFVIVTVFVWIVFVLPKKVFTFKLWINGEKQN